jgi:hypothetical protein
MLGTEELQLNELLQSLDFEMLRREPPQHDNVRWVLSMSRELFTVLSVQTSGFA